MTSLRRLCLALVVVAIWAPEGQGKPLDCQAPFADEFQEKICTNAERRQHEQTLQDAVETLSGLIDDKERVALREEQTAWAQERTDACLRTPDDEIRACHYQRTKVRLAELMMRLDNALAKGNDVLPLLDKRLDIRWAIVHPPDPDALLAKPDWTIVTRLSFHGQVLAEATGQDGFEVVAHRGDASGEAVVMRDRNDGTTYSVVGRPAHAPEIWRHRPTIKGSFVVDPIQDALIVREEPGGIAVRWTPVGGWQTTKRPHERPEPSTPREFAENSGARNTFPGNFQATRTLSLGTKRLTILEDSSWQVLFFDGNNVLESGPRPFDVSPVETVGDSTVVFVDAHDSGNGGCWHQFLVVDTPGHSLRVWTLNEGCHRAIARTRIPEGFLFTTVPSPAADGIRYRWTPSTGLQVDGFLTFSPNSNDSVETLSADADANGAIAWDLLNNTTVFRAFERATGPNSMILARYFDRARVESDSEHDFIIFAECGAVRLCDSGTGTIAAVYQTGARTLFFAVTPGFDLFDPFNPWSGAINAGARLPVEYHPPLDEWPAGAREAVQRGLR